MGYILSGNVSPPAEKKIHSAMFELSKIPTFIIRMPEGNADENGHQKTWATSILSSNIKDDSGHAFQFWSGHAWSKNYAVRLEV